MAVEDSLFIRGRVNRLEQLAEENRLFEMGIKNQIFDLLQGLKSLSASVEQASKNERAKYALKDMVEKIRNVICDAEREICMFTVERKKHTTPEAKCFSEEIQSIRNRVEKIKEDHTQAVQLLIKHAPITDESIEQPVNWLIQVVGEMAPLITGIRDQIDDLVAELKSFTAFLRTALKSDSTNDDDVLKDVLHRIRKVVSDAEDVISEYIWERKKHIEKGVLRYFEPVVYYTRVNGFVKELVAMRDRVKNIRIQNTLAIQMLIHTPPAQLIRKAPVVEEVDVVGFDNEAKTIKDRLKGGSNDLTIISIEGMAGLGKTTLTKMVFKDRDLQYEFFTRLWVYVSRNMNRKQIFLDILSNFTKSTKEFQGMNEDKLAEKIKEYLEGGKYFIVLDDVWTEHDWNCLRIAFPNNNKGSRILVTTRHHNVASRVDSTGNPHMLKFLSIDESWELLEKKVFRKERCPKELVGDGRHIAIKCHGLPLPIVVIAGVLNKDSTTTEWKRIAQDPYPLINNEDMSYNKLVKISYNNLPYNLRDCFLYLAVFPIGHEIATWKLIRLWIAEGFIPLMEGGCSELVVTAEKYLKDLVDRNLLMVLKRRADGQTKTCRIHDTLHEFCKTEGASKNLFYEMEGAKSELKIMPRRICVHSTVLDFLKLENKPSSEHVHSFLSFCSNEIEIPNEHLAVIPKSFRLLRVMDVESLKFKLLPQQLYELSHLRYLAVSTELKVLPVVFNKLWNLQTLVFKTSENSLEVKADMWSMSKLRHVHSNTSMVLPPPPKNAKNSSGSTDIQTLSTISPSSCTAEILEKTPNLQKLGIRGNLAELMESKGKGGVMLFDNLQILDCLENLKLINAFLSSKLQRCPHSEKFPRRLRKMTLSKTTFEWKDLNILGSLQELEVLKLDENAFRGKFCDVRNIVFKQLRYLRIGRTNLVSWKVSKDSFPALEHLILRHCTALDAIPFDFGEVESLKIRDDMMHTCLWFLSIQWRIEHKCLHVLKFIEDLGKAPEISRYCKVPEMIEEVQNRGFDAYATAINFVYLCHFVNTILIGSFNFAKLMQLGTNATFTVSIILYQKQPFSYPQPNQFPGTNLMSFRKSCKLVLMKLGIGAAFDFFVFMALHS
nr:putative late blight resistance protein homolog R1A-3 [Ipomoea trifida]